jgi:adenylylsulfate reductase subunit B
MGGTSIPMRSADSIMWTVKFRNGNVKRFKFPIRTTAEGSIKPFEGKPKGVDINSELLFTETKLAVPSAKGAGAISIGDTERTQCWLDPTCEGVK